MTTTLQSARSQHDEYWHPATETMPRERLRQWQWHKLRLAIDHARHSSKFWSRRLPADLTSLDDYVDRVPVVTRAELIAGQETGPPYGILPSTDPALATRHQQTSGTSGSPPIRSFDTARDWAWSVDVYATALYGMGIRAGQRGIVAFGYGLFVGFWGMHYALEKIGAQVVPVGGLDSRTRVQLLVDLQIDVIGCTPSYAMRLLETAREMGVDLARDGNVSIIMAGGEPRPESTTRAIADGFGARVHNAAGTTELGTVNMFECPHRPGCCHIVESAVIEEVLDPQTLRPVGYGEQGVRVATGIGREGMQLFRHWTEDLVIKRPWHECGCGRTWDWFDRGILGRTDDMRKIRGVSLTPVMVEDVLRTFPDVDEHQVVLRTLRGLDTVVLRVETDTPITDRSTLCRQISEAMKREIGLRPEVEVVERGTLPRFEVKAKRFHDER